MLFLNQL